MGASAPFFNPKFGKHMSQIQQLLFIIVTLTDMMLHGDVVPEGTMLEVERGLRDDWRGSRLARDATAEEIADYRLEQGTADLISDDIQELGRQRGDLKDELYDLGQSKGVLAGEIEGLGVQRTELSDELDQLAAKREALTAEVEALEAKAKKAAAK